MNSIIIEILDTILSSHNNMSKSIHCNLETKITKILTLSTFRHRVMSSSIFADLLTNHNQSSHFLLKDDDDDEDNDLSTLPFPQPLSRPTFSSPDFDTETFLLSHAQFRTLDDLRAELRQWVDRLSDEMETLIGEDWQGYLSLGRGLAGGEQSVRDAERRVKAVEREVQVRPYTTPCREEWANKGDRWLNDGLKRG